MVLTGAGRGFPSPGLSYSAPTEFGIMLKASRGSVFGRDPADRVRSGEQVEFEQGSVTVVPSSGREVGLLHEQGSVHVLFEQGSVTMVPSWVREVGGGVRAGLSGHTALRGGSPGSQELTRSLRFS